MADGAADLDMRQRLAVWRASGVGVTLSPAHVAQIDARFRHVEAHRDALRRLARARREQVTRLRQELDRAEQRRKRIVNGAVALVLILLAGSAAAFGLGLGLGLVIGGV